MGKGSVFVCGGEEKGRGRGKTHLKALLAPMLPWYSKRGREFVVMFYSDGSITTNAFTNDTQKRIISILSANPNATVKAMADELGIVERNIKNHIKALKDAGMVGRVGATKNGQWVVK